MLVTLSGTEIEVKAAQLRNAEVPMVLTPLGSVNDVSFLQELNASSRICVTLSGMETEVMAMQLQKVPASITSTLSGMVTDDSF